MTYKLQFLEELIFNEEYEFSFELPEKVSKDFGGAVKGFRDFFYSNRTKEELHFYFLRYKNRLVEYHKGVIKEINRKHQKLVGLFDRKDYAYYLSLFFIKDKIEELLDMMVNEFQLIFTEEERDVKLLDIIMQTEEQFKEKFRNFQRTASLGKSKSFLTEEENHKYEREHIENNYFYRCMKERCLDSFYTYEQTTLFKLDSLVLDLLFEENEEDAPSLLRDHYEKIRRLLKKQFLKGNILQEDKKHEFLEFCIEIDFAQSETLEIYEDCLKEELRDKTELEQHEKLEKLQARLRDAKSRAKYAPYSIGNIECLEHRAIDGALEVLGRRVEGLGKSLGGAAKDTEGRASFDKLKFGLKREELAYLFMLLKESGTVEAKSKQEVLRWISNCCSSIKSDSLSVQGLNNAYSGARQDVGFLKDFGILLTNLKIQVETEKNRKDRSI